MTSPINSANQTCDYSRGKTTSHRPNLSTLRRRDLLLGLMGLAIAACRPTEDFSDAIQQEAAKATTINLESPAFAANQAIPTKYTCDGADVSPPLTWDAPPTGTQSLVLICDDPDARRSTWIHWVLYNLPPDLRQLPEGISSQPTSPNSGVHGINDFRKIGYGGPCPPKGTHRYFFKLYALDTSLNLAAKATKAQVQKAMLTHIVASGELIGLYARSRL